MKDEEKNLIENLFHRLKKTELNSSERDDSADQLIQKLVIKQPASSYYMTQTILIQETAIKKMSMQIEELKKRIQTFNIDESNKKPSFLSNFFKTNSASPKMSHNDNVWKNKENLVHSYNSNPKISPTIQTQQEPINSRSSGFLSNALQTATGVAGGMILGNMLMNIFNHTKPEEEIFDTINSSSIENHPQEDLLDKTNHHDLVNYETNETNETGINENDSNFENIHNTYDVDYIDDSDVNDDNFI